MEQCLKALLNTHPLEETVTNTWAEGLNPNYQPMDDVRSKIFAIATVEEIGGVKMTEAQKKQLEDEFLIKVLDKRIEVFKLPISFTMHGKLATLGLVDRPGSMMVLLIDCLNAYENQTVTSSMLADLYPSGFYDEPTLMKYIDEYMKERKVKWGQIY